MPTREHVSVICETGNDLGRISIIVSFMKLISFENHDQARARESVECMKHGMHWRNDEHC